jgi:hypothetical protein
MTYKTKHQSFLFTNSVKILFFTLLGLTSYKINAQILNGSFENPSITVNSVNTTSSITNWSKSGNVYIGNGSTAFGNPLPVIGSQFLIFQQVGEISQSFTVSNPTTYTLSLYAAQRNCCGALPHNQTLQIRVDGVLVGTIAPTAFSYVRFKVNLGVLSVGSHSVTLTTTVNTADKTIFLDRVLISQEDNDGVDEENDLDDDNDGILDVDEGLTDVFFWNNTPTLSGNTATGSINGINYVYTDGGTATLTGTAGLLRQNLYPSSYNVPNTNPTIRNMTAGTKTLTFSSPISNPIFVFSSLGARTNVPWGGGSNIVVDVVFSAPVSILWSHTGNSSTTTQINSTTIRGNEGYAIVQMPGVFTSVSFTYSTAENYANFAFGANFPSSIDTDGDGYPDHLDTDSDNDGCPDVVEGGANFVQGASYITNNRLNTTVNTNGVPAVPGGTTGYSQTTGQTVANSIVATQVTVTTAPSDVVVYSPSSTSLSISTTASNSTGFTSGTPVYGTPGNANSNTRYQWYYGDPTSGGTALSNISGIINGVTTSTLSVINSSAIRSGSYCVAVTHLDNSCINEIRCADIQVQIPQPDINQTYVSVSVTGSVTTNDKVVSGSTYGTSPTLASGPSGGSVVSTLTMNSNGTYTFVSNTPGVYVYNVPVCAPGQSTGCPTETLTITVLDNIAVPQPPIANPDIAITQLNTAVTLRTLINDKAATSFSSLNAGSVTVLNPLTGTGTSGTVANGSFSVNTTTGDITFTPATNFVGTVSYQYEVCDNSSTPLCATSFQEITILPAGSANTTLAVDDYAFVSNTNTSGVSGNVLTNDIDAEGNTMTVTAQTVVVNGKGTLTLNTNGSYTFVPVSTYHGPVNFPYTMCDNGTPQACSNATLYILVEDVTILPVSLINLNAECTTDKVIVKWQTTQEMNNSHFEVQKNRNSEWVKIGTVKGAGTSYGVNSYQFNDPMNGEVLHLYRIKQVDFDGHSEISQPILTICSETNAMGNELRLYPNPVTNVLNIVSESESIGNVEVMDINGKRLIVTSIDKASTELDLSHLAPGMYFVKVNEKVFKLVKE